MASIVVAVVVGAVALIASLGGDDEPTGANTPSPTPTPTQTATASASPSARACTTLAAGKGKQTFRAPPCDIIDAQRVYVARLETTMGPLTLELDPAFARKTVNNFVFLARAGYYDGSFFSRIQNEQDPDPAADYAIVQGGDPKGDGSGSPGYYYGGEQPPGVTRYIRGTVAMANSGETATNGSQFFIVVRDWETLPPNYTVFGRVADDRSFATLEAMIDASGEEIPGGLGVRPEPPIVLEKITVDARARG